MVVALRMRRPSSPRGCRADHIRSTPWHAEHQILEHAVHTVAQQAASGRSCVGHVVLTLGLEVLAMCVSHAKSEVDLLMPHPSGKYRFLTRIGVCP
jgi:hypothetical protein